MDTVSQVNNKVTKIKVNLPQHSALEEFPLLDHSEALEDNLETVEISLPCEVDLNHDDHPVEDLMLEAKEDQEFQVQILITVNKRSPFPLIWCKFPSHIALTLVRC